MSPPNADDAVEGLKRRKGISGDGDGVLALPQQVNLHQVDARFQAGKLLLQVSRPPFARSLVAGAKQLNDGHQALSGSVHDFDEGLALDEFADQFHDDGFVKGNFRFGLDSSGSGCGAGRDGGGAFSGGDVGMEDPLWGRRRKSCDQRPLVYAKAIAGRKARG
jgi:hypothetical protein